jgi:hypothetical protein
MIFGLQSRLFISHAAADASLAAYIERQINNNTDFSAFRSSGSGHITPGTDWAAEIRKELRRADAFLLLLTPRSVNRPWLWFEAGAASYSGNTIFPATAGGLSVEEVPPPLSFLQFTSLEDPEAVSNMFREMDGKLHDPCGFVAKVREFRTSHAFE